MFLPGGGHRQFVWMIAAGCLLAPHVAHARDKDVCSDTYVSAQRSQRKGALLQARTELATCLSECDGVPRSDCARWLEEVERALPTLVISVRRGNVDVPAATVMVDERPIVTDGRPIELDPGPHSVAIAEGLITRREVVVLAAGDKTRRIVLELGPAKTTDANGAPISPPSAATSPPTPASRRLTTPVIVAGSVGLVGVAAFATFGSYGAWRYGDLKECRPRCSAEAISTTSTVFAIGDVALVIGVASLALAAVLYVRQPIGSATIVSSAPPGLLAF